ncbi:MAG: hypothetical protein IT422_16800 [Pirellulaceae bacterium]|jgi:hypothetical protein|nr:hypothetical protein [Pirellulaceae bacterium]
MHSPVVQAEFDGVTRDGREMIIRVAIGDAYEITTKSGGIDAGFYIDIEPLMDRRKQGGTDSLMAMCFSIELVRKTLVVFVAHGGSLFARGTRNPIDLQSPWFESVDGMIRSEFLQPGPAQPEKVD